MSIIKKFFGRVSKRKDQPDVFHVKNEEEAMNLAIEKAQHTLDYFKSSLTAPQPQQTYFSLKAHLKDGEYSEHIWLHDVSFDESNNFFGVVGNVPLNLKNIVLGQRVGMGVNDVSDWMIIENERLIGGYTIRVLRDKMSEKERAAFDNSMNFYIDEGVDYFPHDFSTPEGAILCLEDAYRAKDIDRAVACKDFTQEARLMLSKHMEKVAGDEEVITKMEEVLRLSFIKHISEDFPDFKGVQNAFPKREQVNESLVIVTEVCFNPDRTKSLQRLYVGRTEDGWRVLSLAE